METEKPAGLETAESATPAVERAPRKRAISFFEWWHWATTTRSYRLLEKQNAELAAKCNYFENIVLSHAGVAPVPIFEKATLETPAGGYSAQAAPRKQHQPIFRGRCRDDDALRKREAAAAAEAARREKLAEESFEKAVRQAEGMAKQ
jgi:hypothetical protein